MEVNGWFSLNRTNGLDLSIQTEQVEDSGKETE